MKPIRISQLNAAQVEAVFKSERFCQLTDSQLAALHHRSQQLEVQQQSTLQRKRRRHWMIAAAVAVLVAIAPFWQIALALSAVIAIWALLLSAAWGVVQRLRTALSGKKPVP